MMIKRLATTRRLVQTQPIRSFSTTTTASQQQQQQYDYDVVVIGGGSGGLQSSKVAADLGAKVALLDYVKPSSTKGTQWGIGGTCVNVGCIPKKLMHFGAIAGDKIEESVMYGWKVAKQSDASTLDNIFKHFPHEQRRGQFDWRTLVEAVQNTVKGSNFVYRTELKSKKVNYVNALGSLIDRNTIELTNGKGMKSQITSKYIVLAMGGRPHVPDDIPGALEYGITSDDLFTLNEEPGDTLIVGGSYIALETAGFLSAFGYNVDVMVRSQILRDVTFDRETVTLLRENLERTSHIQFLDQSVPLKIEWDDEQQKRKVTFTTTRRSSQEQEQQEQEQEIYHKYYDTVMFATGRRPDTRNLNLKEVGVELDEKSGKVIVNEKEQTSVSNIFAIGDIIENGYNYELTPVAIQQGKLLSCRLFNESQLTVDYNYVPSTVFTPMEYGLVGMSEEMAVDKYGRDQLVIYKKKTNILEYKIPQREEKGFVKLICLKKPNNEEQVIGLHYLGPNAGEVVQGFALALKKGVTKDDFDNLIGIHPTNAEAFVYLIQGITEDKSCCG